MGLDRRHFLMGLAGAAAGPALAAATEVDLALVLAIDCSFSVDAAEFQLQMQGLGGAFQRPEVQAAVSGGELGRIAVAAVQWSDEQNQKVILPWSVIAAPAECQALGLLIADIPRRLAEGGTSISTALLFCAALLETAPPAARRVIDMSSDGRNNVGPAVQAVRDRIVAGGITINGLAILNEWPTLNVYFEQHVTGGQGSFVMPAGDYVNYDEAIFRKLVREITGPGVS